jgi:hypothetical protein
MVRRCVSEKASQVETELDVDLRHNRLKEALCKRLAQQFGKENVGGEQSIGAGRKIDVVVRQGKEFWFYEIKIGSTCRSCVRQAVGQLLEYTYWPGEREAPRLFIVGENPLEPDCEQYLATLKQRFSLPIEYIQAEPI